MARQNRIYFILILLFLIVLYLFNQKSKSTIIKDDLFAVSDTSTITRIFMADRQANIIDLKKINNQWILNEEFKVRKDVINVLLNTISKVKIKRTIPLESIETVIKDMATNGVKIEIFNNDKIIKSYTIGNATSDHLGNYMFLNGSKAPYITHIPGFNGFLSPRYGISVSTLNPNTWRETKIFNYSEDEIIYISLKKFNNINQSFNIYKENKFILKDINDSIVIPNINNIYKLVSNLISLNCESFKEDNVKIKMKNKQPLHQLIVNNDTLLTYPMNNNSVDEKIIKKANVKRMYATVNNGDLMLIQYYVFNKVLINIDELKK